MELLAAAVRTAVAAADAATAGLQQPVKIVRFIAAADGLGGRKHDEDGVETHQALVRRHEGILEARDGRERRYRAVVTFLRPLAFDPKDKLELADGTSGPVLTPQGGTQDPETEMPFFRTVYLGSGA